MLTVETLLATTDKLITDLREVRAVTASSARRHITDTDLRQIVQRYATIRVLAEDVEWNLLLIKRERRRIHAN